MRAQDDFGIKHVGLEWQGTSESPEHGKPAKGERILAAGGNDKDSLEVGGTFSAKSLGIEPQLVNVRLFVEDYLPGRGRIYSADLDVLGHERRATCDLDHASSSANGIGNRSWCVTARCSCTRPTSNFGPYRRKSSTASRIAGGSRTRRWQSGPTAASSRAWSLPVKT